MKKTKDWIYSLRPSEQRAKRTEKYNFVRKAYKIMLLDTLKATRIHYKKDLLKRLLSLVFTLFLILVIYKASKILFTIYINYPSVIELSKTIVTDDDWAIVFNVYFGACIIVIFLIGMLLRAKIKTILDCYYELLVIEDVIETETEKKEIRTIENFIEEKEIEKLVEEEIKENNNEQ